jgi:MFS family permease
MFRPVAAVVDAVMPSRVGRPFRWLWAASTLTNIGDGIVIAAGPLLIASQTRDPFIVSLAFFCEFLPALVLGSFAGVIVDRLDRRRIVVFVNLARAGVLAVLAVTIATETVSVATVLLALLLLATAETFADLAASSLLPQLVRRESLGLANARLQSAHLLMNQLIGPPIGAFLFVVGMAIPFAADALCYAIGAVLVARIAATMPAREAIAVHASAEDTSGEETSAGAATSEGASSEKAAAGVASVWHDLVEGFRWLTAHPPMRTLALTVVAFNVTYGAAISVLVLYAGDRLGMDSVGFGLLTTASAIGGIVVGTPIGGLLARSFGITAPFWFGFIGSAILVAVLWREFRFIAHDDRPAPAAAAG